MSSFEPEQLQDLGKAFNIAWDRIAPNISTRGKHVDTARIMLADIIFGLTRHGHFEPQSRRAISAKPRCFAKPRTPNPGGRSKNRSIWPSTSKTGSG
jgi:hypothetical protein